MWDILRFAIYQYRAYPSSRDHIRAEQQIVLRNTGAKGTIFSFGALGWKRRKEAGLGRPLSKVKRKLFFRSAPIMILGILHILSWTASAGLSSQIAPALDDHLLVRSPDCGFYNDPNVQNLSPGAGYLGRALNSTRTIEEYVQTCYNTSNSLIALCRKFVNRDIKWTSNTNASCPFPPEICLEGRNAAYEMDSGLIDSHKTFGLNAPFRNRVTYRRRTSCAPVTTNGFTGAIDGDLPGEEILLLRYGKRTPTSYDNYTYHISRYAVTGDTGYDLR